MTKPIRNTGLCFHLSLPRQRDVLSHTEFINVHILLAFILQTIPFELPRKPPTANWWVLLLALTEETSITIKIIPCVKCAPKDHSKVVGSLQGQKQRELVAFITTFVHFVGPALPTCSSIRFMFICLGI